MTILLVPTFVDRRQGPPPLGVFVWILELHPTSLSSSPQIRASPFLFSRLPLILKVWFFSFTPVEPSNLFQYLLPNRTHSSCSPTFLTTELCKMTAYNLVWERGAGQGASLRRGTWTRPFLFQWVAAPAPAPPPPFSHPTSSASSNSPSIGNCS